jgi:actin-related protein
MYCGDETGAFIGDIGSHTSRFGYGGEDNPKYVVPSYVSKGTIPSSCYQYRQDTVPVNRMAKCSAEQEPQVDPNAFLQQGDLIEDWNAYEQVWQTSFDVLRVRDALKHTTGGTTLQKATGGITSEIVRSSTKGDGKCVHPLLAVDSGCTHIMGDVDKSMHQKQRTKLLEIMFESLDASSIFVAPSPMLQAFSHGRQTCMVVDVGAGGCRVTPVIDGLLLKNAQRRNGRGGDWLGNIQWKALLEEKMTVQPRYQLRNFTGTPTTAFHRWAMQDAMYEFRSSDLVTMPQWRVDPTTPFIYNDESTEMQVEETEPSFYELPDGQMVDLTTRVGKDLARVPELLYTDSTPFLESRGVFKFENSTVSNLPLAKLVHSSLTAVGDADARKELCGNLLLVGGCSLLPNMEQRLSYEMNIITPNQYRCRVLASRNSVERSYAAWIGGSILTSLGSFQQLWLSRKEYEEYGATLAMQRFP